MYARLVSFFAKKQNSGQMEYISPVYARIVLRHILEQGIPAERLLEGTSLTRHLLETGGDIAMEDFATVLSNGQTLSGNDRLGLMIGRHNNLMTLGAIGVAAAFAPDLREGFRVLENYTVCISPIPKSNFCPGWAVYLFSSGFSNRPAMSTASTWNPPCCWCSSTSK
jgi:hypothetical protein